MLTKLACSGVEFSFNNYKYKQIDGISMRPPIGGTISNIFVEFHEYKLIEKVFPLYWKRYVDDIFVNFKDDNQKNLFITKLNNMHNNLEFTIENAACVSR